MRLSRDQRKQKRKRRPQIIHELVISGARARGARARGNASWERSCSRHERASIRSAEREKEKWVRGTASEGEFSVTPRAKAAHRTAFDSYLLPLRGDRKRGLAAQTAFKFQKQHNYNREAPRIYRRENTALQTRSQPGGRPRPRQRIAPRFRN